MIDQKTYNKIGSKVQKFRERANISQFKLEIMIGLSSGMLSRIESGTVNPTKETIIKIIEALKLNTTEAAGLFDLDLDELPKMVNLARKLSSNLELKKLLQAAVNELVYDLDLLGSVLFLIEGDRIYSKTITQSWYSSLALNFIPGGIESLSVSFQEAPDNFIVKTIQERKIYYSKQLSDFGCPAFSKIVADKLQYLTGHKCAISFPLIFNNEVLGAIMFSKNKIDDFSNDISILQSFADHVSMLIINAREYEKLISKIKRRKM